MILLVNYLNKKQFEIFIDKIGINNNLQWVFENIYKKG